jgi:mRNA interferase MazF
VSPYAVVCPITHTVKGYPFEVLLPEGLSIGGAVLADQVKSIDRRSRRIEPAGKAPDAVVQEVVAKILPLLTDGGLAQDPLGGPAFLRKGQP